MLQTESTAWVCSVPVATVWTAPEKARPVDAEGIAEHPNINNWLKSMSQEDNQDLVNGNRIQTQLLYGEPVLIEEVVNDWAKIIALWQPCQKDERGYPGWVPASQLKEVENLTELGYARVKHNKAQLWTEDFKPLKVVSFNTMLPVKEIGEFIRLQTPDGDALVMTEAVEIVSAYSQSPKGSGVDIAELGADFLDLPYLWAGMSSYGLDCSGLTYNLMKANGVIISRDAVDQVLEGFEVDPSAAESWHIGDLLFFAHEEGKGKIHHVGVYYGNGLMLHSPKPGKSVEIIELAGTKHEVELCAIRRFTEIEDRED
ncbi:NLP/P60 family protein [Planococcus halocryophilus Or1]|uniref:Polysugar degrading enzyme n=1 Tax=Planococcus halocryophilus TaxID=1215089 RepID=A0A1C7DS31_9BACL|nr:C40 family peptidase [Planococcus halocryophilus]ANU14003.1 polysugar degrading enzyme [Planococcus halocryophilus]EMF47399.1 NLP/P60 family protein [Planococcus halocryophilus Or1]